MPSSPLPASLLVTDHILDLFAHAVTWADKVLDAGPTAPPSGQGHAQEPASHCGFWLFLRPGLLPPVYPPPSAYTLRYTYAILRLRISPLPSRATLAHGAAQNGDFANPPSGTIVGRQKGWWQAGMAAPGPPSRTPPTPMQALGCNLHVRGRENPGSAWAVLHSSDVVYVRAVWQSVFAVDSKRAARARFVHARAYAVHRIQPSCPTSPRPT